MSTDEIAQYLDSLSRDDSYRSIAVLKSSEFETTERVVRVSADGSTSGPFIRKTILRDSGLGTAYERLFQAQSGANGSALQCAPHIYECYLRDDSLVVIMQHVKGITLQDIVYQDDPSIELANAYFPRICDAVSVLHEMFSPPLIHRDLKPSNIMIADDRVYIIDFGIAREYKQLSGTDTTFFGTRAYAPPEQFGFGQTTPRSDVYALGMLLYYCITERTPNAQMAQSGFMDADVPECLRPVLVRATAFDPKDRYGSVRELKAAFEAAVRSTSSADENREACAGTPSMHLSADPSVSEGGKYKSADSAVYPSDSAQANAAPDQPITFVTAQPAAPPPANAVPQSAVPVYPTEQPPEQKPISILGVVYNAILVIFVLLVFVAAIFTLGDLPEHQRDKPFWFNAFGYLFVVPSILTSVVLVIMYKRPFAQRFPNTFGKAKTWHYIMAALVLFAVTIFLVAILGRFANVS